MLFGQPTLDDLSDLIRAKDATVNPVQAAFDKFGPDWQDRDMPTFNDFVTDWTNFRHRWDAARKNAQDAINGNSGPVSSSVVVATPQYNAIINAFTQTAGTQSKGDFIDLYQRLSKAMGQNVVTPNIPQPTATDYDLNAFKGAKAATDALNAAAKKGTSTLGLIGIGAAVGIAGLVTLKILTKGII